MIKLNDKVKAALIVALIAALLIASVYAVTYLIGQSNDVTVNVAGAVITIPIVLTANSTSITDLDSITLTVTATGPNVAYSEGKTVAFYDGPALKGWIHARQRSPT